MPDQSEAPIVRKLERRTIGVMLGQIGHATDLLVNPDGPEAAEIIRLCEEALESVLDFRPDDRSPADPYVQIIDHARTVAKSALALIKGQNP